MNKIKVIQSSWLSTLKQKRYVVIDACSSEVLDDAQGYGYKTVRNAYSCYYYKQTHDPKKRNKSH